MQRGQISQSPQPRGHPRIDQCGPREQRPAMHDAMSDHVRCGVNGARVLRGHPRQGRRQLTIGKIVNGTEILASNKRVVVAE